MCEYCGKVKFTTKNNDPTPRLWFKETTIKDITGSSEWHLFYRAGDEIPWYISHNGTIAPIKFCPYCGKKLERICENDKDKDAEVLKEMWEFKNWEPIGTGPGGMCPPIPRFKW